MSHVGYTHDGFCPCCDTPQTFRSDSEWFRDFLICGNCGSLVRERALALVVKEVFPNWRDVFIHESSPAQRGFSERMAREARHYVPSHYFPHEILGTTVNGFRNEDLEKQTFDDEIFDLVVTLDVMEHVFNPKMVYAEIWRTLKKDGYYLHTFPIRKHLVEALTPLATLNSDGSVNHLTATPEYHGNPIDEKGALVTNDYGYDISKQIAQWAPFDVRIIRFWDPTHGVIGEYTEVIVCRK
ncbi:MAG: methyltransferase domain-containing protein [Roseiarcus sp.]